MEPFLGEIKMMTFPFAPAGWAACDGQLLPVAQNQALYSLIDNFFGGAAPSNFALPDFRGRTPLHVGGTHSFAQQGGEQTHALTLNEIPSHTHVLNGTSNTAQSIPGTLTVLGKSDQALYGSASNLVLMDSRSLASAGASQGHENKQPYMVVNFCIALAGIYPSRS